MHRTTEVAHFMSVKDRLAALPTPEARTQEINEELALLRVGTIDNIKLRIGEAYTAPIYLNPKFRLLGRFSKVMAAGMRHVAAIEATSDAPAIALSQFVAKKVVEFADGSTLPEFLKVAPEQAAKLAKAGVEAWKKERVTEARKEKVPAQVVVQPETQNSLLEQASQMFAVEKVGGALRSVLPNIGDKIEELGEGATEFKLLLTYLKKAEGYFHAYLTAYWQVNHPGDVAPAVEAVARAQTRTEQPQPSKTSRRGK